MSSERAAASLDAELHREESRPVDLHLHTTHSDGTRSPAETVHAAVEYGFAAIAVTDHDTVSGVPETLEAGRQLGIDVLTGIEITVEHGGHRMHILGYGIDPDHDELRATVDRLQRGRFDRAKKIVDRLDELGVTIDFDRLVEAAGPGNIGRLHIARAIYEQGAVGTVQGAFRRYIGRGKPAYFGRLSISPKDTLDLLHAAGGLAVLAHPKLDGAGRTIPDLVPVGLDGIEVYHARHGPADVERYKAVADEYGLLKTGGSDCHGPSYDEPPLLGTVRVPYRYYDRLRRKLAER